MATPVTYVGTQYLVPAYQDTGYAQGNGNLSSYLIALATGSLTLSGGNFPLTADANFGASFGLKSLYYKSRNASVASTGIVRLGSAEMICWRDNLDNADLELTTNASDQLTYNGLVIATSTGALVGTTLTLSATSNQMVIGTTNTTTVSYTAPVASRVYTVPDAGGSASFILSAGSQTITGAKTFADQTLLLQETGSTDVITINVAALSASRAYTMPDAGGSASFVMTAGNQTLAGTKTFSSAVPITATSNHLVLSTATNTLTINASTQVTARVWSVPDISANGTFAALEGTQTFTGIKTFSSPITSTDNTNSSITAVASVNGTNPRIRARNTNGTSAQNRMAAIGAEGDNGNDEILMVAGKDSSNNPIQAISGSSTVQFQVGGTQRGYFTGSAPYFHTGTDGDSTNISLRINGPTTTGAQAATILNGPTAGNPALWLQINVNGTNRYIPCWA